MSTESLSSLPLSAHVSGHAHPPQAATAMATDSQENQHLVDLLAKVAFDVQVRGLAASPSAPPYEMYHPRLRKSEMTQHAVSHLDTISCWRGISYAQALELTLWERLFCHCLASRIEARLKDSIAAQLNKRKDRIDDSTLLLVLIQSFPSDSDCLFDIELAQLCHDMTDTFCEEQPSQLTAKNFPWSFGSGDLPSFVYNFLVTQDCFQNTPSGPCLLVNCSMDWFTFPVIAVTASATWHPPAIEFQHVPAQIRPRMHYVIAPRRERIAEDDRQSDYRQYPEFIEYIVTKSSSMVQWDHEAELFRAKAPDRIEAKDAAVSETVVQAKSITRFPGNVRFECTSRYVIRVQLGDTRAGGAATENHQSQISSPTTPCTSTSRRAYAFKPKVCQYSPAAFAGSLSELMERRVPPFSREYYYGDNYARNTDRNDSTKNGDCLNSGEGEKLPKKRSSPLSESKAPSPEGSRLCDSHASSPDTELKRRKLNRADVTNAYVGSPPVYRLCTMACLPQDREPGCEHRKNRAGHSSISVDAAPVAAHTRLDSSSSRLRDEAEEVLSSSSNREMGTQCPTPPYTPLASSSDDSGPGNRFSNTSPLDTGRSPMRHSRTGFKYSSQLSQQAIQDNYHEFEKMALQRLTEQPLSGDMSFEKIFLGDSEAEDWHSSDVEGVSDGTNGFEAEL